jgi:hypothetical protein
MKHNVMVTMPVALAGFFLQCLLTLGQGTEFAHAQVPPDPIDAHVTLVVNKQTVNVFLTPTSCFANPLYLTDTVCSSGSGFVKASLSGAQYSGGPQSVATVQLSLDDAGNWKIAQSVMTPAATASCTPQTPCGGIAQASVDWDFRASSVKVAGKLAATGLQHNSNADFTWEVGNPNLVLGEVGPFCLFISPTDYGPQCPVPQPTGGLPNPTVIGASGNANFSASVSSDLPPNNPIISGFSDVICQGNDACKATTTTTNEPQCDIQIDVYANFTTPGPAGPATPTIAAQFKTADGSKLSDFAKTCNFDGFDWQQLVTSLDCPSPFKPGAPANYRNPHFPTAIARCPAPTLGALTAPPPFNDPPAGGYADLPGYDPFPFYYPVSVATSEDTNVLDNTSDHNPFAPYSDSHIYVNHYDTLSFSDRPVDWCLQGGNPFLVLKERGQLCGGAFNMAPPGSSLGFRTVLVGIQNGKPKQSLAEWEWTDTYNGVVGGISITSHTGNVTVH